MLVNQEGLREAGTILNAGLGQPGENAVPVTLAPWGGVKLSCIPILGVFGSKPTPPGTTGIVRVCYRGIPTHPSLRYLSPNLLHPAKVDIGSGVPESIIPAVSRRSTSAGEVPDPSGRTVQTPDDRPGDPAIVLRTLGIAQGIPEYPFTSSRLRSSDFSSLLTSLLF